MALIEFIMQRLFITNLIKDRLLKMTFIFVDFEGPLILTRG
jgi:hypothetical protein